MLGVLHDLRFAFRALGKHKSFTAVAVITLALGIGANTALFSIVNAALLRLVPADNAHELHWLAVPPHKYGRVLSYPFYETLQDDDHFNGLLGAFPAAVNVRFDANPAHRTWCELVTGSYFSTLGIEPYLGRLITPEDDRVRLGSPVVVVSYSYWQSRLGGDPDALGRSLEINGSAFTLVGVAPPGFGGLKQGYPRDLFVPMQMKPAVTNWDGLDKPLIAWLWIVARLKPGVDPEALGHELGAKLRVFQEQHISEAAGFSPATLRIIRQRSIRLDPLRDAALSARVVAYLKALAWIVGALLLLTCANLAGLMIIRGLERRSEIATRLAVGASRWRLIRQLGAESLLLATGGSAAGLFLGAAAGPVLASLFPLAGPGSQLDVPLDSNLVAFAIAISTLAALTFGLLPAWRSSKVDLAGALKGPAPQRSRQLLLSGQVALALVLLVVAGLFAKNLRELLTHDLGFTSRDLVIAEIDPSIAGYDEAQRFAFYRELQQRLDDAAQSPGAGVSRFALSNVAPLSGFGWSSMFIVEGREDEMDLIPRAVAVGPGYFETLGIELRRGRLLETFDGPNAPQVAVISESLAAKAFPGSDPIGQRFVSDTRDREGSIFEIVGIAQDIALIDPRRRDDRERVYLPHEQINNVPFAITIQARLASPESAPAAIAALRNILGELDPNISLYDIRTIEAATDAMLAAERLAAWLSAFLALFATLLVATGLYGVLGREVKIRAREFAIRVAVGATRGALVWSLVRRASTFVALGLAFGAIVLVWTRPFLGPLLVDIEPGDPAVVAAAVTALIAAVAFAILVPARAVLSQNPSRILRVS